MTQRRIYQCAFPYFVTFNVLDREWLFEDKKKAKLLHEIILNAGSLKNHHVYQFCIMPDHVHILCQTLPLQNNLHRGLENPLCARNVGFSTRVTGADCACGQSHIFHISDFIKSIRGTFSRYMKKGRIWHPRFYDQVIGNTDRLHATIEYIVRNPTKANLPKKYHLPPYQYKNDGLIEDVLY